MKISFRFLVCCALAPAYAAGFSARAAGASRPNVLFIITDQQFSEALSCRMGNTFLHTPALDNLAKEGMFFTRAYAANPLCAPSRTSMFTGRYPHETGVTKNAPLTMVDPAEFVNLGTYFQRAGYETAYYGKWHMGFREKDTHSHGFTAMATKMSDADTASNAVQFLRRAHDRPFLMVASFLNPHNICEFARDEPLSNGPVGTPPPDDGLPPAPANLAPPRNEPDTMTIMRQSYHASPVFPVGNFDVEKWRQLRWAYYRMIEKSDAEIGRLLEALRQSELEANTLIVFTSDHGECAGAHGFNQKTVFYEESARVPLIVSFKGRTHSETSGRLVNTGLDILPTMLDFAGIEQPKKLTGRSLRRLALGEPVASWRDYVVAENNMAQGAAVGNLLPTVEGRMLRDGRYKYCVYSRGRQRESLVDLEMDPGEMIDLATDPASRDILMRHRELLREFARENHDALATELLDGDVKPLPFTNELAPKAR